MRKILPALLLCLATTGCIKLDTVFTLRPNGSGTIKIDYSISNQSSKQILAMLKLRDQLATFTGNGQAGEGSGSIPEDNMLKLFLDPQEAVLKQELMRYAHYGLTIEKIKVDARGTFKNVNIVVLFNSLANLAKTDFFSRHGFALARTSGGNYLLTRPSELMNSQPPDLFANPQSLPLLTSVLQGFNVEIRFNAPSKILFANSHRTLPSSAIWTYDFDRNPNAFSMLQRQSFRTEFDGRGMTLPEIAFKSASAAQERAK